MHIIIMDIYYVTINYAVTLYILDHFIELSAKVVAKAFWMGEVEGELRRIGKLEFCFKRDEDLDKCMQVIEEERRYSVYPHSPEDCTSGCKERG